MSGHTCLHNNIRWKLLHTNTDAYKTNGQCQSYSVMVHFPAHSINKTNKAVYQRSKTIIMKNGMTKP